MPYDPNYPPTNALIESAPLRGQFNGLKALIDAISTITAAQVDAVNSVPPDSPAQVNLSVTGNTLHFSFDLPRGYDGSNGQDGAPGAPFAQAVVDGVNTLEPWESATVGVTFDGTDVHFTFGIPRGNDGTSGSDGAPGEVSLQQLSDAIATTSANSDGVGTLDLFISDPPTQAEVQDVVNKINELIVALRRV